MRLISDPCFWLYHHNRTGLLHVSPGRSATSTAADDGQLRQTQQVARHRSRTIGTPPYIVLCRAAQQQLIFVLIPLIQLGALVLQRHAQRREIRSA